MGSELYYEAYERAIESYRPEEYGGKDWEELTEEEQQEEIEKEIDNSYYYYSEEL
jgi:hypothetical protein